METLHSDGSFSSYL